MAGIGKRMRPHTLTTPKPLLPIAGSPMVQLLTEDLLKLSGGKIDEIGFVIGRFGKEAEANLLKIASDAGVKGKIYYQDEALGTAHAVLCAGELLNGNVIIAFADTLFLGEVKFDEGLDGVIWVQKVKDPSAYGVVKLDKDNVITDFVEKPEKFVSDLAIIGIYYFRDGAYLKNELQYLLDIDKKVKGEFWLTDAMENMKNKGTRLSVAYVDEWLDCGNKNAMLYTNKRILEAKTIKSQTFSLDSRSKIIEPCFIGENCIIKNSIIGPFTSIGSNCTIENSAIADSIIRESTSIINSNLNESMVGRFSQIADCVQNLNIGDYSQIDGYKE
jgi:glucose-1-phosphate thymidylyltransferase